MTSSITVVDTRGGPNLLIRAIWFLLIGWWLAFLWINLAALVSITVIGIPLGVWMMNRIPQIVTLKSDRTRVTTTMAEDGTVVKLSVVPQRPFWQRAVWFVLVGWWLTWVVLNLAWLMCITIVLLPLAFPIFSATGKMLTLKRG